MPHARYYLKCVSNTVTNANNIPVCIGSQTVQNSPPAIPAVYQLYITTPLHFTMLHFNSNHSKHRNSKQEHTPKPIRSLLPLFAMQLYSDFWSRHHRNVSIRARAPQRPGTLICPVRKTGNSSTGVHRDTRNAAWSRSKKREINKLFPVEMPLTVERELQRSRDTVHPAGTLSLLLRPEVQHKLTTCMCAM